MVVSVRFVWFVVWGSTESVAYSQPRALQPPTACLQGRGLNNLKRVFGVPCYTDFNYSTVCPQTLF